MLILWNYSRCRNNLKQKTEKIIFIAIIGFITGRDNMGWKGTIRSITAAARAAERESQRRYKQELLKQTAADAAQSIADWEEYIDNALKIHTNIKDSIDWHTIATKEMPVAPVLDQKHQIKWNNALNKFKPGFFDFLFGGTERRIEKIKKNIEEAPFLDQADYDVALEIYNNDYKEWHDETKLARQLLSGDPSAIQNVIKELQTLSDESLIGTSISFSVKENLIHAMPVVHSDEIIPNYRLKQLASGKLSETKMPIGQFNELYQDYVASVALKVASDIFQIIPLEEVFVSCLSNMLNTQTGHMEDMPILSVKFIRNTFMNLNLDQIDPSDSLRNFNHKMNFQKSKGFTQIIPLLPTK